MKVLHNIFTATNMSEVKIASVTFFLDSQIALSWILKRQALKKNVFINNRIEETIKLMVYFKESEINYQYIPSENNVADVITRGCSAQEYKSKFDYWLRHRLRRKSLKM